MLFLGALCLCTCCIMWKVFGLLFALSVFDPILIRFCFFVQPNRILLVTIHHMLYPITVEVLQQVFSPYGFVEKIVTFQKSAGQLHLSLFLSHNHTQIDIFRRSHMCTHWLISVLPLINECGSCSCFPSLLKHKLWLPSSSASNSKNMLVVVEESRTFIRLLFLNIGWTLIWSNL